MTRLIYNTATTLDGYLADDSDSLEWLFAVPGAAEAESSFPAFLEGIGAMVMGSTTYEWVYAHEGLAEHPERWRSAYGERFVLVLTSRALPVPAGAGVRLFSGAVREAWAELESAAAGRDVWVVGGGDVVGQFADAGLLDEIRVSIAPATLGSGKPLLPRVLGSDRLTLESVRQSGQFAELVYAVGRPA
ncbi:dihydrofolate reductase family protein [Microbacterium sp. BK668]|uniref:dihydrofolate reductase family protein n=1 Tax=Microbacterium sp. BK668 TaxID=2512118 RepID=UPI00105C8310|nr:dihydrofolate reductase family protein [Microbacterium sp. BK668]TDN92990.1 dihydrofolate reductase [Microbacterium sp. BK668]